MLQDKQVGENYEKFYAQRSRGKLYPTEFVVRTFLANYPNLNFSKLPIGASVLDIGFGDGRNTFFLCEQGFAVSGVELTEGINTQLKKRLNKVGLDADLQVGHNSAIPFPNAYFDCILACHSCYYCNEEQTFHDNMQEYSRVLKPNGYLVASIAKSDSYIFKNAIRNADGTFTINNDPYGNRNGYRLHAFVNSEEAERMLSSYFKNFSFGVAQNDYYGIDERLIWVVCQKRMI
ncbi:class I SAM-dependent methyltransferase [Desulfovibrio litoralis]|uniref:Ubiquinone/menaquinone biosynthesis C-methylase UbiE n=1 Tax=Desulfovibrio litoralis DSM 11393 TaxID=1121455 RepID=A0A1M7T228_9BACT|nr:class I SAM-dependent methyltransferase [Desulfovibrio litoralis]SHN64766.1 Ubiquinone/menaquinone biosynthesis C-methylase UbiE [Desulfovibrio litoralis DSM 11393]